MKKIQFTKLFLLFNIDIIDPVTFLNESKFNIKGAFSIMVDLCAAKLRYAFNLCFFDHQLNLFQLRLTIYGLQVFETKLVIQVNTVKLGGDNNCSGRAGKICSS